MIDVPDKAISFKSKVLGQFGPRIKCLILTGSHARGDSREDSDIDLWLIFDEVRIDDLRELGNIVTSLAAGPGTSAEINAQCATFDELKSRVFTEQFSPVQLYCEGIILHGKLDLSKPTKEELLTECGRIASFVLMGARHYISVQESETSLQQGRVEKWILNPLMWALRYEILANTNVYARTLDDLLLATSSNRMSSLINLRKELLRCKYAGPYMPIVEKVALLTRQMIERINKEIPL